MVRSTALALVGIFLFAVVASSDAAAASSEVGNLHVPLLRSGDKGTYTIQMVVDPASQDKPRVKADDWSGGNALPPAPETLEPYQEFQVGPPVTITSPTGHQHLAYSAHVKQYGIGSDGKQILGDEGLVFIDAADLSELAVARGAPLSIERRFGQDDRLAVNPDAIDWPRVSSFSLSKSTPNSACLVFGPSLKADWPFRWGSDGRFTDKTTLDGYCVPGKFVFPSVGGEGRMGPTVRSGLVFNRTETLDGREAYVFRNSCCPGLEGETSEEIWLSKDVPVPVRVVEHWIDTTTTWTLSSFTAGRLPLPTADNEDAFPLVVTPVPSVSPWIAVAWLASAAVTVLAIWVGRRTARRQRPSTPSSGTTAAPFVLGTIAPSPRPFARGWRTAPPGIRWSVGFLWLIAVGYAASAWPRGETRLPDPYLQLAGIPFTWMATHSIPIGPAAVVFAAGATAMALLRGSRPARMVATILFALDLAGSIAGFLPTTLPPNLAGVIDLVFIFVLWSWPADQFLLPARARIASSTSA